ncbi:hypothetical protein R3W88_020389 [Solanum pinnatisectum]|uniref:Receptor-like serine/threonine-protein kinase n=1 Tax=Solanum pinnatisectum TaxID=50273 RepID=A0AAV9KN38_9SOLN|nr:hypothetical protein R3W88_020389 [Solanum pinnatisectum]
MMEEHRQCFAIFFFVYLVFCSSQLAKSQRLVNFISGVPTLWINRPSMWSNFSGGILNYTPIVLEGNARLRFLYGFYCNFYNTECFLGGTVWSANRDHPVQVNATLQLGRDGNLVLADSGGTLVWSTNTTGKSVSGLNLTETGNLVLFDTTNCTVWQSFDHPTDYLLPGQNLVSGQKLTARVSADDSSQGLFSLTVLNGSFATYIDSDPPQYYYTSDSPSSSFDGHTLTALQYPPTSIAQYIQLGHDGHLRVYQLDNLENNMFGLNWKEVRDILTLSDCGYPMVCGRYSIFNFFRPFSEGKSNLGCTELTPISCAAFPKCTGHFPRQKSPFKVIIGCTLIGIILILSVCSALFKKRLEKHKAGDFLDLEPILLGIITRFSYNELKIITDDFSRKLGKGGFVSVYEGTLSSGTKIAVKHLDGVGQVKESFLTEVKTVGGIHHINLVKLIGYCAEKIHRLLIYEYMVNGSLDRWITQEIGLTWNTMQMVISDIVKGLAYLHEDCSHKIIHLDIKPQNILLDQNFNAKISDFGLSKLIEKDKSKVVTRMRGTLGYIAPEWLSSIITEKVDVYAFGIVLLEILCGRKNLDWSQTDEEDVHLLTVFTRKAEQEQLTDMVDRNEDMQLHREAMTEMMSLAVWCLQGDFSKRPSMSLVVKALEGLVTVETNLDYNFRNVPKVGAGNQPREAAISSKLPSVLSGPR